MKLRFVHTGCLGSPDSWIGIRFPGSVRFLSPHIRRGFNVRVMKIGIVLGLKGEEERFIDEGGSKKVREWEKESLGIPKREFWD
jgi:hypothetical protein